MSETEQPKPHPSDLKHIEEQERYLVRSKTAITQALKELSGKPDLVTAYFNNGKEYILTVVLAVLRERNLAVFDYGPDQAQNTRLLETGRMVCVSRHNDILIRFAVTGLQKARYQGQPVIAAPLPEVLLKLQRREYFRVNTPVINPVLCRLPPQEGKTVTLTLTDISAGGLGMLDPEMRFQAESGDTFKHCTLVFPGEEASLDIDLQIRNIFATGTEKRQPMQRIGAAYLNLPMDKHAFIQRYIHHLQVQQNTLRRD